MSARDTILAAIREALDRGPLDATRRATLATRVPTHTRPSFEEEGSALIARFVRKFESRAGTVARIASHSAIPAAVEAYRLAHDLPRRAVVGTGVGDLTWPDGWDISHGAADVATTLSLSPCFAGVAETGSLIFCAGPDSPTSHNFAPDDHIVVLETTQIVRHFEDVWVPLRQRDAGMPRATNIVSGPSRTADVEQTIQLGAHGPRRMHVLLIEAAG